MPVVLTYKGYRFFFFSNEGIPREPMHIHVRKGEAVAKFWINPTALVESYDFSSKELSEIKDVILENEKLIERSWNEYFNT